MKNLTPTEYDEFARVNGVRAALNHYPYTLTYRYAGSEHNWTMFYPNEVSRRQHANIITAINGRILGASGGDTSELTIGGK